MGDDSNKIADEASVESESPAEVEGQAAPSEEVAAESVVVEGRADDAVGEEVEADGEGQEEQEEVAEEDRAGEGEPEKVEPVVEEATAEDGAGDAIQKDWYILKVQSNRERSISEALRRKIAIEGLEDYFGDVIVPVEKVTEFKAGKKKVVERKLYPGYIVVHMHINDDTWFAVRETSGIGDFTGSGGKPTPMLPHEVARIVQTEEEETEDLPKLNIAFNLGDQVKVKEGTFESFEGEVHAIDEHSGRVTVMINIFGRSTPVELEYWQAEQV